MQGIGSLPYPTLPSPQSPSLQILVHTLLLPVVSGLMMSCSRMNSPASRSFCLYQPLSFNPFLSFLPQTHFYFRPCLPSSCLQKECANPSPSRTSSQHFPQSPFSQTTFESTWGRCGEVTVPICNPSTWEAETEWSWVCSPFLKQTN